MSERPVRIGMVAGEISGDILGVGLIKELRRRYPNAIFEGIGGPLMIEEGFKTHVPMERLSVMGLVEVLGRLFELIGIRRKIRQYFLENRPDVFIGIDAPDFTLGLEESLRKSGIKTAHYVSPSVWAWRQKRVFKIARAVDLMLTLFPFEARFYKDHKVPVAFVGHPLADMIPLESPQVLAREKLGLLSTPIGPSQNVVALLPGSRSGEIHYLGEIFIETAKFMLSQNPDVKFLLPYVNEDRKQQIEEIMQRLGPELPITLIKGQSRDVMAASNVILLASGTATLEAMLLKRPMVVAYRMSAITFFIMKRLMKAPYIALPNLLANKALVPELIQAQASPQNLGKSLLQRLAKNSENEALNNEFIQIHQTLKQDASDKAAIAVSRLIDHDAN
ncbi:lipid-A-disaccharide synthase [Alkalimarinus alittae]|uniref:Lipid-A-disaccharide synthase n=1 Tax=Alkalimarinus alittae TaxID=2961619 RepID=A0ABY6N7F0_9ALTE|nr:lipid-A-disaccharide synthase [Alkalimarinus alittae]UZE98048.1 lipid-A-disaccharide synthase [Alkalimarinus alittae]